VQDSLQTVIFSAPLVSNGGIQLDFGDSTTLQLANKQWQDLFAQMKKVQSYDPNADFIVGFSVAASAVDPNPTDHNATRIVPFSQIFTINTYSRK